MHYTNNIFRRYDACTTLLNKKAAIKGKIESLVLRVRENDKHIRRFFFEAREPRRKLDQSCIPNTKIILYTRTYVKRKNEARQTDVI